MMVAELSKALRMGRFIQQSTINNSSHALALAADQDVCHRMGNAAGFGQGAVRSVPAGVGGVVAGGTSFAMAALTTASTMDDDFVRAGGPVFVNEELGSVSAWRGRLRNQAYFGRDFLQAGARVATHGDERQPVNLFELTHHGENSLYRKRARLDEVGLHQRQVFAIQIACGGPIVVESRARQFGHLAGDFIGCDGDHSNAAQSDYRQRNRIVAGENQETFASAADGFGDLSHVAACFFHADDVRDLAEARQRGRLDVRTGASGNVVEDDRLVANSFCNGLEMAVLALLRGFVVVRRGRKDRVYAGTSRKFLRLFYRIVRGVRRSSGDDGNAPGGDFDCRVNYVEPFVVGQSRRLARCAAGYEEVNSGFDLPGDEVPKGGVVDRSVLLKWRNQCSATTVDLHRDKIARRGGGGK